MNLSEQDNRKRHDECLLTIRRAMMALLAFALFCLLTIGRSDKEIFEGDLSVVVPFAQVPVSFKAFLLVAPVLLILIWSYLQFFIRELDGSELSALRSRIPTMVVLSQRAPKFFFWLISDALVPALLVAMTFRALFLPYAPWWFVFLLAVFVWRGLRTSRAKLGSIVLWSTFLIFALIVAIAPNYARSVWQIDLRRADLTGKEMRRLRLTHADFAHAKLEEANLKDATLRNANLFRSVLSNAILRRADLSLIDGRYAIFSKAELVDAMFIEARLNGAEFGNAELHGANFRGADLSSANLKGAIGLRQPQLDEACADMSVLLDNRYRQPPPCKVN